MQKYVTIVKKESSKKLSKSINYWKVRDHCHYTDKYRAAAYTICNLKFNVPNETRVVSHIIKVTIIILS